MKGATDIYDLLTTGPRATVPRQMVHRHAISEVFLTDGAQIAEDHYQCAVQFPRTNTYFNDNPWQSYDMILLIEVFRQASIYVAHAWLGADMSAKFMYIGSETTILVPDGLRVGRTPTNAIIDITLVEDQIRRGERNGATLALELLIDGMPTARETVRFRWMTPDLWQRMRAKGLEQVDMRAPLSTHCPAHPETVGRQHPDNVVVARDVADTAEGLRTDLIVNVNNPATFDHPLDHVPGMVILDGFRQSAILAAHRWFAARPVEIHLNHCKLDFHRIAEFSPDTQCRIPRRHVRGTEACAFAEFAELAMVQGNATIATATLGFTYRAIALNATRNDVFPETMRV